MVTTKTRIRGVTGGCAAAEIAAAVMVVFSAIPAVVGRWWRWVGDDDDGVGRVIQRWWCLSGGDGVRGL
ncbi:hypothetical protein Tco_0206386 [Tanacetum coccineum]